MVSSRNGRPPSIVGRERPAGKRSRLGRPRGRFAPL